MGVEPINNHPILSRAALPNLPTSAHASSVGPQSLLQVDQDSNLELRVWSPTVYHSTYPPILRKVRDSNPHALSGGYGLATRRDAILPTFHGVSGRTRTAVLRVAAGYLASRPPRPQRRTWDSNPQRLLHRYALSRRAPRPAGRPPWGDRGGSNPP